MTSIELNGVNKRYGNVEVIRSLDLEIPGNKLTVLLGPSGCGKSTLLRMIAGLEDISAGDIRIDGEVVNERGPKERGCAMVFQSYALYPHKTVYENLAFPLRMERAPADAIDRRVHEVAQQLHIEDYLQRRPKDLSGGQRQRVAMGRAMIRRPKVFLFDEPLSNLDAELRVRLRLEISRMQKELQATMIFVTHDQVEAMTLADTIVIMRAGEIQQMGSPMDIYSAPANRFVATFIGSPSMNIYHVTPLASGAFNLANGATIATDRLLPADAAHIGIRPEHVEMPPKDTDNSVTLAADTVHLIGVEHLGDRSYAHFETAIGEVTLQLPVGQSPDTSRDLTIRFPPEHLHFFDANGAMI